jgi:hypothetical protein
MKDLSTRARAHLDALRQIDAPESGAKARVWDAVMVRAGLGELGPEIPPDPPPPAAAASPWSIVVGAVIGVAAIAGAAALATHDDVDAASPSLARLGERVASVAPVATPVEVAVPAPPSPPPTDDLVAIPSAPESSARTEPTRRPIKRPRSAEVTDAPASDTFAEEVALLASARAALGAGDAKQAIAILSTHAKRFGAGKLAREREVSWITALCALGRDEEAKRRAADFLRRDDDSPHAAKVRASCGGPR